MNISARAQGPTASETDVEVLSVLMNGATQAADEVGPGPALVQRRNQAGKVSDPGEFHESSSTTSADAGRHGLQDAVPSGCPELPKVTELRQNLRSAEADDGLPQPQDVTDPAQFVAAMRQLRLWADLSYRQLERRANAAGDVLPRTTLAGVLNRPELPREELLASYVRACGGDEDMVGAWVKARRRLAVEPENPSAVVPVRSTAAGALTSATSSGTTRVSSRASRLPQVAVNRTPVHGWSGPASVRWSASRRAASGFSGVVRPTARSRPSVSYRPRTSSCGRRRVPVSPPLIASEVSRRHWWSVGIRGLQYSPAERAESRLAQSDA